MGLLRKCVCAEIGLPPPNRRIIVVVICLNGISVLCTLFFQKWLLLHILIITSICFALLETIKKWRCLWKIIFFSHIFLIYKLNDVNNVCRIFCRHISSFKLTFCSSIFSFKNIDCFLVKNDKQSSILSLFVYKSKVCTQSLKILTNVRTPI
jgi:hypothetical protein